MPRNSRARPAQTEKAERESLDPNSASTALQEIAGNHAGFFTGRPRSWTYSKLRHGSGCLPKLAQSPGRRPVCRDIGLTKRSGGKKQHVEAFSRRAISLDNHRQL